MAGTVRARLAALVSAGRLQPDPLQSAAADALDRVLDGIRDSQPPRKAGALGWLLARGREQRDPPRGLYLHGGVGRGKTMLMDLFFAAVPAEGKRRIHFNDFMADAHDRIIRQREARRRGETREDDPIPPVARALAAQASVLCFDEFAVSDIADAMILSRLFSALFAHGVVLVATSNVAPQDLYRDGLNRALFLPFIALLQSRCAVMALDGPTDYRQQRLSGVPAYLTPLSPETDRALDEAWSAATAGRSERPAVLSVMGRSLEVPRAAGEAARFRFNDLCGKALGSRDYLALADRFPTVFVEDVPVLAEGRRNEAKRFILLVDTLYDRHTRLFVSAAAEPELLYRGRSGTEAFEWARTASRLREMQGRDWAEAWEARQARQKP